VELAPDNSRYLWRLYKNYRELDREDQAREVLEDILKLPDTNDFVRETAAEIKEKAKTKMEGVN